MRSNRVRHSLYLFALSAVAAFMVAAGSFSCCICAEDVIVEDTKQETESEGIPEAETESEAGPLVEAETEYEIPAGIVDGLKKDTPTGEAAQMSLAECEAFLGEMCQANSAQVLWEKHDDVSAVFRVFDEDAKRWEDYSTFYADPMTYYSDDWTPGLEELRLLIYGKNGCVEDYTKSMRFICFLNASGTPYRDGRTDPVTLGSDTADEMLLAIHRMPDALYVVTQLAASSIYRLGLDDPEEGAFYSGLYVLDPDSLELKAILISLHGTDRSAKAVQSMSYSYDHGMTPFVETGCMGLMRHLEAGAAWAPEDLRQVTVTLDPGTDAQRVFVLTTLKGDPVSVTLPEGYTLYSDETLTTRWVDDGNYTSDLELWAR